MHGKRFDIRRLGSVAFVALLAGCSPPAADTTAGISADVAAATPGAIERVQEWVQGYYNNVYQFEADMAAGLPPEETHRPMHQLFVPLAAPKLDGYIVFQQSSMDGSENPAMIFRHGLMQYFEDPETGVLVQRELYFKEPEPYKNLHHNPELLAEVTLDEMTWDAGCDFHLTLNAAGDKLAGPLPGQCVLLNRGTQQNMYADDRVEITATEYAFHGRYRDADGNIVWGTSSEELNRLVRQ